MNKITADYGVVQSFYPFGNGHINDTWRSSDGRYVLQRLNPDVFHDPAAVMRNMSVVTEHLYRKYSLATAHGPGMTALRLVPTLQGKPCSFDDAGLCYRLTLFVENSMTAEPGLATDAALIEECGRGYGLFLRDLSDLDPRELTETIPRFHDTADRYAALLAAAGADVCSRRQEAAEELGYAAASAYKTAVITDGIREGSIPLCAVHNDTKLNNILFDRHTSRALCVIDLDTVMPGSRLYDYGDALRTAASTAAEDEMDLSRIGVDHRAFTAFTRGFLSVLSGVLTERERELLPFSFWLMTFECGIRFLTDYLEGDRYFKTAYPAHNLDRARNQLIFARKIEEALPRLEKEITEIMAELKMQDAANIKRLFLQKK